VTGARDFRCTFLMRFLFYLILLYYGMGNILGEKEKRKKKWLSRTDTSRQIILIARGKYKKKKTQKKTIFIFYFILFYKTPWENRTPGKIRQQFSLAGLFWLCPVCVCVCVHTISRLFVTCWASEIIQPFWTVVVDQEAKRKREGK
jgi:hypothetical protein